MLNTNHRSCPICSNSDSEILHEQFFSLAEKHILPSSYFVVTCKKCGFVYADTLANQAAYDIYYKNMSKYEDTLSSGGGDNEIDNKRLNQTASEISSFLNTTQLSVLDIGCGRGGLLNALREKGFTDLTGFDPSRACISYIQSLDLKAFCGSIFDTENKITRKYDLIVLTHVLEHIIDLDEAIRQIIHALNPKGLLYVETPDASRYKVFPKVPFYYFDTEHINHFDPFSLSQLLTMRGFDVIQTKQKTMEVAKGEMYPAAYCIAQKTEGLTNCQVSYSSEASNSVKEYIELSKKGSDFRVIEELKISQEPIVVFGTGNFTMRLLASSSLARCNIVAYIDNDRSKQNQTIHNVKVHPISILSKINAPVLVCSVLFSDDIVEQIRLQGYQNKIIVVK